MVRPHVLLTYCLGESRSIPDDKKLATLEEDFFKRLEARAKHLRERNAPPDADEFRGDPTEHRLSLGTALNNIVGIFVHGESGGSLDALEGNFHRDSPSDAVTMRRDEVYAAIAARLNQRTCDGVKLQLPATRQEFALIQARWLRAASGPRRKF